MDVTLTTGGRDLPILRDITIILRPGEVLGVIGESGSGKSTLAAAILGVLPGNARIARGSARLGPIELVGLGEGDYRKLRGAQIAMIFQDPLSSLNPTFTIGAQMRRVLKAHGNNVGRVAFRAMATAALSRVGMPAPEQALDRYPHQFSGGMRQRILIAMAILLRPKVIIADEPTSALDASLQAQILDLLRSIAREEGTSLIFISHDLRAIARISDEVAVLYAGRVVEQGCMENVISAPLHPYTQALLASAPSLERRFTKLVSIPGRVPEPGQRTSGCNFCGRCPVAFDPCSRLLPDPTRIDRTLVYCHQYDRQFDSVPIPQPRTASAVVTPADSGELVHADNIVSVRTVSTNYVDYSERLRSIFLKSARRKILDCVTMDVKRGEIVGIVGESGAGKTTLAKAIAGLLPVSSGSILFDGIDITKVTRTERRQLRLKTQFVFQDAHASLSPRMRIGSLLREPASIHRMRAEDRLSPRELLSMVELGPEHENKYPHELSGGQARRVGLARALSTRPNLVIADEPSAGLDVSAAASILNLIQQLKREWETTYIIITHDLDLLGYIADRIVVMKDGRIVETGTADSILGRPQHSYTRQLLDALSIG